VLGTAVKHSERELASSQEAAKVSEARDRGMGYVHFVGRPVGEVVGMIVGALVWARLTLHQAAMRAAAAAPDRMVFCLALGGEKLSSSNRLRGGKGRSDRATNFA
jgi:hypothetical protein